MNDNNNIINNKNTGGVFRAKGAASLIGAISSFASCLADLIFPLSCSSCAGHASKKDYPVCAECRGRINYIRSLEAFNDIACPEICGFFSLGPYEGVLKDLTAAFKYHKKTALAGFFAGELASRFNGFFPLAPLSGFDVFIPVPLHENKLRERGFNQAELLAYKLSETCGAGVCCDAVTRKKETRVQNKLHYKERFENLAGAFEINFKKLYEIRLKNVIIVDDIITTGATVKSMAQLLKRHGAFNVFAISIARTDIRNGQKSKTFKNSFK
jgi:ComF family protein